MVVRRDGISVVEAKAGATVSEDMFGGLRRACGSLSLPAPAEACLVHGGDESQARSNVAVVSWKDVHKHRWL